MGLELDHIAIAAETLEEGIAWVEERLGVPLQPGGQHPHFGTHNYLLGLAERLYLEVIAIDPDASALPYPRWFDLDNFSGPPRITNWICRTDDLLGALQVHPTAGTPVSLRRADLRWQMAVPETGKLPYDNVFPALIEWGSDHPAPRLNQQGCRLDQLIISHPEAAGLSEALGLKSDILRYEFGPSAIHAAFTTPHGTRSL